jgi:hypothetical protein
MKEKASHLGTLLWACFTMLLERKREEESVTTLKGGPWKCVVTENRQHAPLTWREPAKISKLLLVDFAATHSTKVKKKYVLQQKLSTYKNQNYN